MSVSLSIYVFLDFMTDFYDARVLDDLHGQDCGVFLLVFSWGTHNLA